MFELSSEWKTQQKEGKVRASLRLTLFRCFVVELKSRLEMLANKPEALEQSIKMQWRAKDGDKIAWTYLRYDVEKKEEIQDPDRQHLDHQKAIEAVTTILQYVNEDTLHRFHATRPMAATYEGENLCFLIQVSLRGLEAQKLHEALTTLVQSAVLNLMGARLKKERIHRARGGLAIQDAVEHVRSLALLNSANVCYQNSFVLSAMLAFAFCSGMVDPAAEPYGGAITGRLVTVLRRLHDTHTPIHLHSILDWGSFLQDWRQPLRQHDVSEFASFILQQAGPQILQITWQARDVAGGVREVGELTQPIGLNIGGDHRDFQACINAWHRQDHTHALQAAAPLVCFQLGRFKRGRRITKIRKCLRPSHVCVPVFRDGTADVEHVRYRLVSMVIHLGTSPNAGHYRAILMPGESHSALGANPTFPMMNFVKRVSLMMVLPLV